MSEFWLISAPGDKENLQALERMNTVTSKSNLSYNTKFAIPDFKVKFPGRTREMMDRVGWEGVFWEAKDKNNRAKAAALTVSLGGSVDRGSHWSEWDFTSQPTLVTVPVDLEPQDGMDRERGMWGAVFSKNGNSILHTWALASCS